jgi:opacity protein-like surface antigen
MSGRRVIAATVAIVISLCSFLSSADSFSGEKSLGVNVGYNTYNKEPLAGLQFSYRFNKLLRLCPEAEYVFRRDGRDALRLNLNMEFVFPMAQGRCDLFPLVGLHFASWNWHPAAIGEFTNDVSTRISRLGLNFGAGGSVNISSSMRLSVTASYNLIKDFGGVNIVAGLHYRF